MTTELPYAADAEVSLSYDELEVSIHSSVLADTFISFCRSSMDGMLTSRDSYVLGGHGSMRTLL